MCEKVLVLQKTDLTFAFRHLLYCCDSSQQVQNNIPHKGFVSEILQCLDLLNRMNLSNGMVIGIPFDVTGRENVCVNTATSTRVMGF